MPWNIDMERNNGNKEICAHPGIDSYIKKSVNTTQRLSCAGDKIKFEYTGTNHNVIELTKEKYDDCEV